MAESPVEMGDEEMQWHGIHPNGPVHGVPVWSVVSGGGTLYSDPTHKDWEPGLPEGHQMFLVAPTLPVTEPGPVAVVYEVAADVDLGTGVQLLVERITRQVKNKATSLSVESKAPVPKPSHDRA